MVTLTGQCWVLTCVCLAAPLYACLITLLILQIISAQFPPKTSQRSKRLLGMILEANGELDDAEKLYKGMLELNKANALAYKRLVCVAMARGDADGAVKQLNDYVKNFTGDHSAVSIMRFYRLPCSCHPPVFAVAAAG